MTKEEAARYMGWKLFWGYGRIVKFTPKTMSITGNLDPDNYAITQVEIAGQIYGAIIDTGGSINMISSELSNKLILPTAKGYYNLLTNPVIGDIQTNVYDIVINLCGHEDKLGMSLEFGIMNHRPGYDILLGIPFLQRCKRFSYFGGNPGRFELDM